MPQELPDEKELEDKLREGIDVEKSFQFLSDNIGNVMETYKTILSDFQQ